MQRELGQSIQKPSEAGSITWKLSVGSKTTYKVDAPSSSEIAELCKTVKDRIQQNAQTSDMWTDERRWLTEDHLDIGRAMRGGQLYVKRRSKTRAQAYQLANEAQKLVTSLTTLGGVSHDGPGGPESKKRKAEVADVLRGVQVLSQSCKTWAEEDASTQAVETQEEDSDGVVKITVWPDDEDWQPHRAKRSR